MKILPKIILFFLLTSCATFDPKPGMTLEKLDSMAALSFLGGMEYVGKHAILSDVKIYETFDQQSSNKRIYFKTSQPNKYYYIKGNRLLSEEQLNKLIDIEKEKEIEIEKYHIAAEERKQQEKIAAENRQRLFEKQLEEEKKEKEKIRENCLSSGDIGICLVSIQDARINICESIPAKETESQLNAFMFSVLTGNPNKAVDPELFVDPNCYIFDKSSIIALLEVRNNTQTNIKDVVFECNQIAKSGTVLDRNVETIYDIWQLGEVKEIKLKLHKHSQYFGISCRAVNWE